MGWDEEQTQGLSVYRPRQATHRKQEKEREGERERERWGCNARLAIASARSVVLAPEGTRQLIHLIRIIRPYRRLRARRSAVRTADAHL